MLCKQYFRWFEHEKFIHLGLRVGDTVVYIWPKSNREVWVQAQASLHPGV